MPRRAVPRDSKDQIFQAAAAEFAERGFEAAGVDRIADKARVNKAMIYYHFGSKLELYTAVLRDMFGAVNARVRAIADHAGPAEQKMDAWVAAIVEEAGRRTWFPPIMMRELASGFGHVDAETLAILGSIFSGVRDILAQGQQEGTFRDVDPLLTHLTIMPAVLAFFARERALAGARKGAGLTAARPLASPRSREDFIQHMQQAVRGMLRKD